MRAVLLEVPAGLLADRRQQGIDGRDEMWEGVLHMVPPPSGPHQRLASELLMLLGPVAKARRLVPVMEAGLFAADDDYRVPDLIFARPEHCTDRGFRGDVPLVVELLSPGDESRAKLDFYAVLGVGEVLLIDPPTRVVELWANLAGTMVAVEPGPEGIRVAALDVTLTTLAAVLGTDGDPLAPAGPRLCILTAQTMVEL
ncbi:MAG: Uma2 family endonuclease [Acidimicrobiales bacterium]